MSYNKCLYYLSQIAAKRILTDIIAKASWLLYLSTELHSTDFQWLKIWFSSTIFGIILSQCLLILLCRWVDGKCGLWFWETTRIGPKCLLAVSISLWDWVNYWLVDFKMLHQLRSSSKRNYRRNTYEHNNNTYMITFQRAFQGGRISPLFLYAI